MFCPHGNKTCRYLTALNVDSELRCTHPNIGKILIGRVFWSKNKNNVGWTNIIPIKDMPDFIKDFVE